MLFCSVFDDGLSFCFLVPGPGLICFNNKITMKHDEGLILLGRLGYLLFLSRYLPFVLQGMDTAFFWYILRFLFVGRVILPSDRFIFSRIGSRVMASINSKIFRVLCIFC